MIEITGYITEAIGKDGFMIKITSDAVPSLSLRNIQVSREVAVFINKYHYPADFKDIFEKVTIGENRRRKIDKSRSFSDALRPGDRVECVVYIVEEETHNGVEIYRINSNRRDLQDYADFHLWLYPNTDHFKRLPTDTPETIEFRKQNYYRHVNQQACEKITGESNKYTRKWWTNKNPKITFPMLWWVRFRTAVSNLWKRLTGQENLSKASLIANIILAFITTISIAVNIIFAWLLFFKGV